MLSPAAEILLSYLTGLAPVGNPIEPRQETVMADLGYRQKVSVYRCLTELMMAGCVRKIARGCSGTVGVVAVVRRLEALPERHLKRDLRRDCEAAIGYVEPPDEPIGSAGRGDAVSRADWNARLAEIPPDTCNLTSRMLGDPIPSDRRRASSAHRPKITLPSFA